VVGDRATACRALPADGGLIRCVELAIRPWPGREGRRDKNRRRAHRTAIALLGAAEAVLTAEPSPSLGAGWSCCPCFGRLFRPGGSNGRLPDSAAAAWPTGPKIKRQSKTTSARPGLPDRGSASEIGGKFMRTVSAWAACTERGWTPKATGGLPTVSGI